MKQYWIMVIMYEAILDNGKHNSTYPYHFTDICYGVINPKSNNK